MTFTTQENIEAIAVGHAVLFLMATVGVAFYRYRVKLAQWRKSSLHRARGDRLAARKPYRGAGS